jgi:uncharacterized sodium:solute symporter family permease YidK
MMLASLVAAFMSTIDTQLNWGASYLLNDFYRRFIVKNASERHYVVVSIIATIFMAMCGALMAFIMSSIVGAWQLLIAINAGIGVVYLLRWYWWRINAWSELSAMISALCVAIVLFNFTDVRFPISLLYSVPITAAVWLTVTLLTKPVEESKLIEFYKRVRPGGPFWKKIRSKIPGTEHDRIGYKRFIGWICGIAMVYFSLFGLGEIFLKGSIIGYITVLLAILSGYFTYRLATAG